MQSWPSLPNIDVAHLEAMLVAIKHIEEADFREAAPILEWLAIGHPDPIIRASALQSIMSFWPNDKYIQLGLQVLREDDDEDPRSVAITQLGNYIERFGTNFIIPIILERVKDDHETNLVRRSAYWVLLTTKGKPLPSPFDAWDAEQNIDWEFINSFE